MGFNSVIFIYNDAMGEIDKDPVGWWEKTKATLASPGRLPESYGFGSHANGFIAVSNMHADGVALIAAGGNHVTVLNVTGHTSHHLPKEQKKLIEEMAGKLGYNLVKKSKQVLGGNILRLERMMETSRTFTSHRRAVEDEIRLEWLRKIAKLPDQLIPPSRELILQAHRDNSIRLAWFKVPGPGWLVGYVGSSPASDDPNIGRILVEQRAYHYRYEVEPTHSLMSDIWIPESVAKDHELRGDEWSWETFPGEKHG